MAKKAAAAAAAAAAKEAASAEDGKNAEAEPKAKLADETVKLSRPRSLGQLSHTATKGSYEC